MADPQDVTTPQDLWKLEKVLYNDDEEDWSVASGTWGGDPVIAIRWNVVIANRWNVTDDDRGFPVYRNQPAWFILPSVVGILVEGLAKVLDGAKTQARSERKV